MRSTTQDNLASNVEKIKESNEHIEAYSRILISCVVITALASSLQLAVLIIQTVVK